MMADKDQPGTMQAAEQEGAGGADLVGAAEAAVAKLKANYLDWLREDIARLREASAAAAAEPRDRQRHLDRAYAVSHDIKGQGGTFGFDLVTTLGQSLCDFIKTGRAGTDAGLGVVDAHIEAIEVIANEEIEGDGGSAGRALLDRVAALVEDAG